MLKIALCVEKQELCPEKVENYIGLADGKIPHRVQVQIFYTMESLEKRLGLEPALDLIFSDRKAEKMNGLEIQRMLREDYQNQKTQMVFLSQSQLLLAASLAKESLKRESPFFVYQKGRHLYKILLSRILYFEAQKRQVKMVTTKGVIHFYRSFHDIAHALEGYGFMMTHKSFLVNCDHIMKLGPTEVELSNLEVVPISRKMRASINKKREYLTRQKIE